MEIRIVGAEFYSDGNREMANVIIAFRNFAIAPNNR
jgi:hypothetical protein